MGSLLLSLVGLQLEALLPGRENWEPEVQLYVACTCCQALLKGQEMFLVLFTQKVVESDQPIQYDRALNRKVMEI